MKRCKKCQENKPLNEFYKDKKSSDSLKNDCKECRKKAVKDYTNHNKEKYLSYQKNIYIKNKEQRLQYRRKYYLMNRNKINKQHSNYMKLRRFNDANFRLLGCLRGGLYKCLKGLLKNHKTVDYIGCSIEELWIHLESKFQEGMIKDNYGLWHVDHIKPLSSFNFNDVDKEYQLKLAWNYSNLQPLWAKDNLKKGARH